MLFDLAFETKCKYKQYGNCGLILFNITPLSLSLSLSLSLIRKKILLTEWQNDLQTSKRQILMTMNQDQGSHSYNIGFLMLYYLGVCITQYDPYKNNTDHLFK